MKKEEDNSFGVTSVVLGATGIAFVLFTPLGFLASFIFGIIGLILAKKQNEILKNKWAKWGKILAIINFVLTILVIIAMIYIAKNPQILSQYLSQTALQ